MQSLQFGTKGASFQLHFYLCEVRSRPTVYNYCYYHASMYQIAILHCLPNHIYTEVSLCSERLKPVYNSIPRIAASVIKEN